MDVYFRRGEGAPRRSRRNKQRIRKNTGPVVYFIQAGFRGPIKIGYTSKSIARRFTNMQTDCPDLLYIRGTMPGARELERRLHEQFSAHYHSPWGEWFKPVPELVAFILHNASREHCTDGHDNWVFLMTREVVSERAHEERQ